MSAESTTWLNQMVLIGKSAERGKAWHFDAKAQGAESNHYEGFVPVEDAKRRLFDWTPVEGRIAATVLNEDGVLTVHDDDRKAIIRPAGALGPESQAKILGIFKSGYRIHEYKDTLLVTVERLLDQSIDDDLLGIAATGLLREGGVAFVQFQSPETMSVAGFEFRPYLTAATSLDGSLSSTFTTGVDAAVCDNTLSSAISNASTKVKIKHSRNSVGKINNLRDALGIINTVGEDFTQQAESLLDVKVSEGDWAKFLDEISPLKDAKGEDKEGRSLALATSKRETLNRLWNHDERVKPWAGTAFGVVQAVNTATHHEFTVKGAERMERNMLRMVTGEWDKIDASTLASLEKALA
jgi:phage/plasmid-like protein (TIGR03299 family)